MGRRRLPLLLAAALLAASCGGAGSSVFSSGPGTTAAPVTAPASTTTPAAPTTTTSTTTTSTTIPPTTTTLPPALPVVGWEGEGVREVVVEIEFDYPTRIPDLMIPVQQALRDVGVSPMPGAEAVLRLEMTGSPEPAQYSDLGTCYMGARLVGTASLVAPGREPLLAGIEGRVSAPLVIYADECASSAEEAPFGDAFAVPLIRVMTALFGPGSVPYLTAIVDTGFPEGWWDRWYGRLWAALDAFRGLDREPIGAEAVHGFLRACIASIWWLRPDFSASPDFTLDDDMRSHIDHVRQVLLDYSDTDYGFEDRTDIDEWHTWLDGWLAAQT
jgi:hypothetical protein